MTSIGPWGPGALRHRLSLAVKRERVVNALPLPCNLLLSSWPALDTNAPRPWICALEIRRKIVPRATRPCRTCSAPPLKRQHRACSRAPPDRTFDGRVPRVRVGRPGPCVCGAGRRGVAVLATDGIGPNTNSCCARGRSIATTRPDTAARARLYQARSLSGEAAGFGGYFGRPKTPGRPGLLRARGSRESHGRKGVWVAEPAAIGR